MNVADILDKHIARTEEPRGADGLWHPSSMGSCDRQSVYSMRGTPVSDPNDAKSGRIFRVGHTLHEIIQRALAEDSGASAVYNEVSVDVPDLGITGHGDSLLRWDIENVEDPYAEYELIELKSINTNSIRYLTGPKPEHEMQVRTYAYALRHYGGLWDHPDGTEMEILPLGDALTKMQVVYVDKNELKIVPFPLTVDRGWEYDLEQRMERLNRYRTEGEALPPRVPPDAKGNPPKWPCGYCNWRTRCYNQDGEGVEL